MNNIDPQGFVIKICGLTTEQDTAAAISAGPSAIGLNFYPKSPRFLTLDQARALASLIPPEIARVGVFVNATAGELTRVLESVSLDVLQLHGTLPDLDSLPNTFRLWRATPVTPDFRFSELSATFEAHLLDSPSPQFGGSGQSFDWRRARGPAGVRVILAGGLNPSNVALAIQTAAPRGVDASSGLEFAPGRKDPEKMKAFVEAARAAFLALHARAAAATTATPEPISK